MTGTSPSTCGDRVSRKSDPKKGRRRAGPVASFQAVYLIIILEDGQAIRIIADTRHGRDDGAPMKVDHPHRPARRGVGIEARPARDDGVASVQRDRGALRAARADLTVSVCRT